MRALLVLGVVALTSLVSVVAVARGGVSGLAAAVGVVLEALGATVVLFVANVGFGVVLILAARRLTPYYAPLYEMTDITLLVLSLLQALTITAWMHSRRPPP